MTSETFAYFDIEFGSRSFIRLYLSNGRAVVMVVVRPSSVRNGCIRPTAKRCEIRPKLLLIIDRKSHTGFQMKCKSSTLDDFQGH